MKNEGNISSLVENCHSNAMEKGFWEASDNISEKVMLVVTELSEGVEAYRNGRVTDSKDCFAEELADAVIRICDIAGFLKIDLEKEILTKMEYNRKRPYLHGKKF